MRGVGGQSMTAQRCKLRVMKAILQRQHPERRRALIIGAGPTGMAAAFHVGEHSLLLERRDSLGDFHDHSHDFPMGAAYCGALGDEDTGADGDGWAAPAEGKALFISCYSRSQTDTGEHTLIHVERWRPPDLAPSRPAPRTGSQPSVRTLRPLLRGELRMGAHVVRISPEAHLLELVDGHRFVYDKLVSTLSLTATELLVAHDLPGHVRRDESLRYWLSEQDIEVVDRTAQDQWGDLDEFAAGKRIAHQISHALANKFRNAGCYGARGTRLFEPRLVCASAAPSMP
jgi:hypothetical protein